MAKSRKRKANKVTAPRQAIRVRRWGLWLGLPCLAFVGIGVIGAMGVRSDTIGRTEARVTTKFANFAVVADRPGRTFMKLENQKGLMVDGLGVFGFDTFMDGKNNEDITVRNSIAVAPEARP